MLGISIATAETSDSCPLRLRDGIALSDECWLALSNDVEVGITHDEYTSKLAVRLLRHNGAARNYESMPDLPKLTRNDFVALAITGGNLMVMGGSDSKYRGCSPCRADTYILNPKTKSWSKGPAMLEARSEHNATHLSDGSILVTGGWTPAQGWGVGPSRSAERWNPVTNQFEAVGPMPSGTALHQRIWIPNQVDGEVILAGGINPAIFTYAPQKNMWKTVGASSQNSMSGSCTCIPVVRNGQIYVNTTPRRDSEPFKGDCHVMGESIPLWLSPSLNSPTLAPTAFEPSSHMTTYRSGAAFLPASATKSALMIGGHYNFGAHAAATEAFGQDGNIRPLASLNEPRSYAKAFQFSGGVLLIGGHSGSNGNTEGNKSTLPIEWLADTSEIDSPWIKFSGGVALDASSVGQLANNRLIEVTRNGKINLLKVSPKNAKLLKVNRSDFPALNRARKTMDAQEMRIRELPDGRIVVAGGVVQTERIALLKPDSLLSDAIDEYISVGPYLPARRHEIYVPSQKRWRNSAPSFGSGGRVAIMNDGRVTKIGMIQTSDSEQPQYLFEISNPEGTSWNRLSGKALPKMHLSSNVIPYVIDGELFASANENGANSVEWYDAEKQLWEGLWSAASGDSWKDNIGRVIVRRLSNGKVVTLPVEGY